MQIVGGFMKRLLALVIFIMLLCFLDYKQVVNQKKVWNENAFPYLRKYKISPNFVSAKIPNIFIFTKITLLCIFYIYIYQKGRLPVQSDWIWSCMKLFV